MMEFVQRFRAQAATGTLTASDSAYRPNVDEAWCDDAKGALFWMNFALTLD